MYSVQAIPVTNDKTVQTDAAQNVQQLLTQENIYKWLLPEKKYCLYFDVVGRQLVRQNTPPNNASTKISTFLNSGFEKMRTQLARIDAHLFSVIVTSVFVSNKRKNNNEEETEQYDDETNTTDDEKFKILVETLGEVIVDYMKKKEYLLCNSYRYQNGLILHYMICHREE